MNSAGSIEVNGRNYVRPVNPAVVICLDGCEPAYLHAAIADGLMPALKAMRVVGTDRSAHCVIPSFTNPNNMSIATGRPPAVHGICGNYFYDPVADAEVMMNDLRFLRAPTVFDALHQAGARVAIVTAKDKLRALLGAGLNFEEGRAMCFSAEKAESSTLDAHGLDQATAWLGRKQPSVYSADLSEFVFAAGVKLLRDWSADVMYLTTTDYIQHKFAPDHAEAKAFYQMFDGYLAELNALGAAIVITADHGMKPKHDASGAPQVVYVQDVLDEWLGTAAARVILPITDPYVVHHGALGSFATAYLPREVDPEEVIMRLRALEGIQDVFGRAEAAARYDLPEDRIGDVVMVSTENMTIGTSADRHDLAALDAPLRSHGGLSEQVVPFICNRVLDLPHAPDLRNYDALFYAVQAAALQKTDV